MDRRSIVLALAPSLGPADIPWRRSCASRNPYGEGQL